MPRGTRFRAPSYDPASGDPYRPGTGFEPQNAVKLIDMCTTLNMSVAGFLNALVAAVEVDAETGAPVGWPAKAHLKEAS